MNVKALKVSNPAALMIVISYRIKICVTWKKRILAFRD